MKVSAESGISNNLFMQRWMKEEGPSQGLKGSLLKPVLIIAVICVFIQMLITMIALQCLKLMLPIRVATGRTLKGARTCRTQLLQWCDVTLAVNLESH